MPALLGGLLIGISLGLLGSGGSILTVPALVYGVGHPERLAIAESLLIVGGIALLGSLQYVRAKRICWKSVLVFGVPGMAGTYLGAAVAPFVTGTVQLVVFGVVMLAAAAMMFRRGKPESADRKLPEHPLALIALEGIAVGALTGFVGVGGGFLIVPALVFLRGLPIHLAVGTSLMIIALKSVTGFVKYLDVLRAEQLTIDWITVVAFVAFGAIGTLLGTRLNRRLDARVLRRAFAVFLIAMAVFILYREGGSLADGSRSGGEGRTASEDSTSPTRPGLQINEVPDP